MRAAVYARVSTERQERQQTIGSQLAALRTWAEAEGHDLNDHYVFRDEGCSGSRLDRPGLDALRDNVRDGEVEILGVLAPDRLARKYAYQVLLLEEFRRAGCAVAFLNRAISDDPGDQLLLQIRGAVAEYERSPGDFRCAKTPRSPSACAGGACASCKPAFCCPGQGRPTAFASIPVFAQQITRAAARSGRGAPG